MSGRIFQNKCAYVLINLSLSRVPYIFQYSAVFDGFKADMPGEILLKKSSPIESPSDKRAQYAGWKINRLECFQIDLRCWLVTVIANCPPFGMVKTIVSI